MLNYFHYCAILFSQGGESTLLLYENIRKYRLMANMSQSELARRTGYTDRSSIAKVEKGLVDLSQSKISQFASALGVTPSELMGWEQEQKKNDALADIVLRLRTDEELFDVVNAICNLDKEKLSSLATFLK
jgi:transcriptional regulator with XRE-family HTH domain